MRKVKFIIALMLAFIVLKCTYQPGNPIEGFWDMQYAEWSTADTTFVFMKSESNQQVKVFERNHFIWLQEDLKADSTNQDLIIGGFGSYTMSGDTVFEVLEMSPWPDDHGKSLSSKIEIRGDSLIQTFPFPGDTPEMWEEWTGKEIYVRID
jgi:hypothetical protein